MRKESLHPLSEGDAREDKAGLSRQRFLKSALTAGALGAVGGIAGRKAEDFIREQVEEPAQPESPVDPSQEQNERYAKFVEAVEAGDQESIKLATEIIGRYSGEMQRLVNVYGKLQTRLPQVPAGGNRALLEFELQYIKDRQDWISAMIKLLRDPIDLYLEKRKSPQSMPKITLPGESKSKIST